MTLIDKFLPMVLDMEEDGLLSPILIYDKTTFVYTKHNNLYCILETNVKSVMCFCYILNFVIFLSNFPL